MMDIFSIFIYVAIIIYGFFKLLEVKEKKNTRRLYCVLMFFFLFLIAALRNTSVGFDSGQYARMFYIIKDYSLKEVFQYKEPGYTLLIYLLKYVSSNHQILFVTVSAIFSLSISRFIYKYSNNVMASFVMLIPMMYFALSLTALRQTIAISISLISIDFILARRFIPFLLLMAFAFTFHKSVLFFIPAYFLYGKELSTRRICILTFLGPIIYLIRRPVLSLVQRFIYSEYSIAPIGNEIGTYTTLIVYLLILISTFIFRKNIIEKNRIFILLFSMLFFGSYIQMFVPLEPSIFRIVTYYSISSIILVPDIIEIQEKKVVKLFGYMIFFALMVTEYYFFTFNAAGVNPYRFFWQ